MDRMRRSSLKRKSRDCRQPRLLFESSTAALTEIADFRSSGPYPRKKWSVKLHTWGGVLKKLLTRQPPDSSVWILLFLIHHAPEKHTGKGWRKRQSFQGPCHGSCHHILRSSLFTSTQMLSLSFMVQCGHPAEHLIPEPVGTWKKAIARLHF